MFCLHLPAKVQSYMAAGKPILASANGEIANVIRESGAGFCASANDDQGFVNIVKLFLNSDDRNDLGKKAKQYYDNNFSREKVMNKLEKILVEEAERI